MGERKGRGILRGEGEGGKEGGGGKTKGREGRKQGRKEATYLPGLPAQSRQVSGTRPPMQLWSDMVFFGGGGGSPEVSPQEGRRL